MINYCKSCAKPELSKWKGWPHKDRIPTLPKIIENICERCTDDKIIKSTEINWTNIHGEHNTGLPDYWLLTISDYDSQWGKPYANEILCSTCEEMCIVSEFYGKYLLNCNNCNILAPIINQL